MNLYKKIDGEIGEAANFSDDIKIADIEAYIKADI